MPHELEPHAAAKGIPIIANNRFMWQHLSLIILIGYLIAN